MHEIGRKFDNDDKVILILRETMLSFNFPCLPKLIEKKLKCALRVRDKLLSNFFITLVFVFLHIRKAFTALKKNCNLNLVSINDAVYCSHSHPH